VAHSLSAKKRIRQNIKRRARNRARKARIRIQVREFNQALATGNFEKAEAALRQATKLLCRTADKGTIHKRAAARRRSRLTRRLNAARAAAAAGGRAGDTPATPGTTA